MVTKYLAFKTKKILILECDMHANEKVNSIKSQGGHNLLPPH